MPVPGQAAPPSSPIPAAGEPGESQADRIRDEMAGFQLGQRAARAGEPAPEGPEPPALPRRGPAGYPPRIPSHPPAPQAREDAVRREGDRPARPGEDRLGRIGNPDGGAEADET